MILERLTERKKEIEHEAKVIDSCIKFLSEKDQSPGEQSDEKWQAKLISSMNNMIKNHKEEIEIKKRKLDAVETVLINFIDNSI